jgi:hypothetical protein
MPKTTNDGEHSFMATVLEHPNTANVSDKPAKEAPNNLEAEQAVLGAILANNEALNHVGSTLEAGDFYAGIHQRIYKAILQFHDKGLIANPVTLKHHFTGLGYDVFFDDAHAWVFTPNLAIGFYNDANGKNLGGSREYKSSLEFAYQWPDEQRLGIAIQHISNAEKYEQNPGTELLTIQYAMPIDVLSR